MAKPLLVTFWLISIQSFLKEWELLAKFTELAFLKCSISAFHTHTKILLRQLPKPKCVALDAWTTAWEPLWYQWTMKFPWNQQESKVRRWWPALCTCSPLLSPGDPWLGPTFQAAMIQFHPAHSTRHAYPSAWDFKPSGWHSCSTHQN